MKLVFRKKLEEIATNIFQQMHNEDNFLEKNNYSFTYSSSEGITSEILQKKEFYEQTFISYEVLKEYLSNLKTEYKANNFIDKLNQRILSNRHKNIVDILISFDSLFYDDLMPFRDDEPMSYEDEDRLYEFIDIRETNIDKYVSKRNANFTEKNIYNVISAYIDSYRVNIKDKPLILNRSEEQQIKLILNASQGKSNYDNSKRKAKPKN